MAPSNRQKSLKKGLYRVLTVYSDCRLSCTHHQMILMLATTAAIMMVTLQGCSHHNKQRVVDATHAKNNAPAQLDLPTCCSSSAVTVGYFTP